MALLLQGRFVDFDRLYGPRQEASEHHDGPEFQLLLATREFTHGRTEDAARRYVSLAAAEASPDLRATACILGAIVLSDAARHAEATALLDRTADDVAARLEHLPAEHEDDLTALAAGLLELHRSWRLAAGGQWDEAANRATEIHEAIARHHGPVAETISLVARVNAANYADRAAPGGAPPRIPHHQPTPPPLQRQFRDLAQGLEALLADEARSTFQHLRQREVLWRAEDPVERGLWRATLHAESLADFEGMRRTRTQLGRTRLLRGAREGQAPDAEAFRLLVHGGNPQEVVRAARWYRSRGPADVLAEAVDTVATLPWPAPDEQATVELLHAAGDLLHPAQTNDVTDHLLDLATGAGPALARAYAVDDAALRALAQVTHGAEPDSLESIAQRLLGFLEATQRPLIIRDVSAVVQTIRWQELSATTTEPWRAFAEDETPGPDETDSLRAAVVLQLAKVDAAWAVAVALAAYERRPTLLWAAVAVDIGMPLPEELVEQMTRRAVEALGDERDEAAEGRHRLGEVEPADLLCALLLRHPTQPGWHQLVQYVSDPATNVEGTGRVADRLAHGLPSLDASVADEIRALFGEGPLELWGTDANAFQHRRVVPRGPSLRLSLALSAGESDQWSAELIALAGSTEDEDRFEAAWTSASAAALPQTAGFVAYLLTRDRTPEVRAAAGQAILKLLAATSAGQSVAHSAHLLTQVKTLLREPGVTAPFAVLRGIVAAGAHPRDEELGSLVTNLTQDHPSAVVRGAAHQAKDVLRA